MFAHIYRTYGAEVTIVEMLPRLIPVEDEEIGREIQVEMEMADEQTAARPPTGERSGMKPGNFHSALVEIPPFLRRAVAQERVEIPTLLRRAVAQERNE